MVIERKGDTDTVSFRSLGLLNLCVCVKKKLILLFSTAVMH